MASPNASSATWQFGVSSNGDGSVRSRIASNFHGELNPLNIEFVSFREQLDRKL
jgi:hypothetical protein